MDGPTPLSMLEDKIDNSKLGSNRILDKRFDPYSLISLMSHDITRAEIGPLNSFPIRI